MFISEDDLKRLVSLHEQSLHFQAFQIAQSLAPLTEWEGTDAIITASNIAHNLGGIELSDNLTVKAWRKDKKHPRALFYQARNVFHRRGALPALLFVRKYDKDFQADAKLQAWWLCHQAEIFAALRDFKSADALHQKAVETAPAEPWIWNSRAHLLELQDRYDESLEISRKAFEMDGGQRNSVYQTAHILTLLERYDEALAILTDAAQRLENAWIVRQLADLQTELEMHGEALKSLERMVELTPFREKKLDEWIYGSLSDAAYLTGDVQKAIEYAEKSATQYHLKIKERFENLKGDEKRVRLKLGFVRQHHFTCAPATLSNISRFWQKKAEHLELAEEMCYDGTPAYKERLWAEQNGWETREFTINWEDTAELINRGVPFTLATINPGNGHLQAVVGYDERRRTFLIRDPFYQRFDEYAADELLEEQKSSGPRGLALVPREKAELLQNLELKESAIYDYHFAVDAALEKNDREKAAAAMAAMEKEFPAHRLTWSARWTLAQYDANNLKLLEAVEKLREQFPEDVNLKLAFLGISSEFASRVERLKKLEEFARAKKSDPLLRQMFGYELGADANLHERALRWLYKSLRVLPSAGLSYRYIADILWAKRRFEEAVELYRFAACLNDKEENFSYSYFLAMRFLKREEDALRFLRDRFERFGQRSDLPVRSLFHALRELGRMSEAFDLLDEALGKRPDDGELKLFAAEAKARFGRKAEAENLLKQAEKQAPRRIWLKNAAMIAEFSGNLEQSLKYLRETAALEPTSPEVHERIAFLLSALEGKSSALDYLRKTARQFPFNLELQKLRLGYLRDETTEAIAVLRDLIRINPQDTWSRRELARRFSEVKKYENALEQAQAAVDFDPSDAANFWALGMVLAETKQTDEAAKNFEKALSLAVDADFAFNSWMNVCRTNEEKVGVLRFMREELGKQTNFGTGIFAYREQAKRILEPKELLAQLKQFYAQNKEQWFALSVVVQQLVDMHQLDEALEHAEENTERFPFIYQVWHDLALVYKMRGDTEKEVKAMRQAVGVNPNWSYGIQQLVEALQRAGWFAEARIVLREALTRMPLDPFLHGYLAEIQWKLGERENALETARRAITIEPEYEWAWHVIKSWSEELKQPELAVETARELTVKKPKDARSWLTYAQILDSGKFLQEQLDAAEEALKLEPENTLALAIKGNSLADARRFDEAIAVCRTVFADGHRSERLRFVEAGIEATRGNYQNSIKLLESLTKDAPDYYPAFERLAGIYREWEDKKFEYLRVTREMTRLAPQEPTVFGFLGEANLLNDKREEAKKAFQQALSLAPSYDYAGAMLFDLHFEDGETEDSRRVVELLNRFVNNETSHPRAAVFYAKSGDLERAEKHLRELFLSEKANLRHFQYVADKFRALRLANPDFVLEILRQVSPDDRANPLVGAFFMEICRQNKSEKECREYLEKLTVGSGVWEKAVSKYLEILLESDRKKLNKFIRENYEKLKISDGVWSSTGYALYATDQTDEGLKWFADWRTRQNVEPWALWNYSLLLKSLRRDAETRELHETALILPQSDDTVNLHLMMLALDEVYAENYESAQNLFAQINPQVMQTWDKFFYFLLERNLEIYRLYHEGKTDDAQFETEYLANECLSIPNSQTDIVMSVYFERSLKAALALSRSGMFKLKMRSRAFLSRFKA